MKAVSKNLLPISIKAVSRYITIFYACGQKDGILQEVAFQYNDGYTENIFSFVNNINTPDGGTHLIGFKSGLTKTLNDYGKKIGILKDADKEASAMMSEKAFPQSSALKLRIHSLKGRQRRNWALAKRRMPWKAF